MEQKTFPKEKLLKTTFYFKISHELELCVNKNESTYCQIEFTHEKPIKGKRKVMRYEKAKLAKKLGIKTIKEMDRLIKNVSKKQYSGEMED